jgi:hypothetical protein
MRPWIFSETNHWPRDWRHARLYAQASTNYGPRVPRHRPDDGGIRWVPLAHRGTRGTSRAEMDRRIRKIQRSL